MNEKETVFEWCNILPNMIYIDRRSHLVGEELVNKQKRGVTVDHLEDSVPFTNYLLIKLDVRMCKKGVEKPIYRNMEEGFVSKQGNDL